MRVKEWQGDVVFLHEVAKTSVVKAALAAISPDELTPRSALETLYRLKGLLKN